MAKLQLRIDREIAWEFEHHLPALWPWLFDPASITESRKLFSTVHDAACRFDDWRRVVMSVPQFADLVRPFEELNGGDWSRHLDARPDAVLSLDLLGFESARPYGHEVRSSQWATFREAAEAGDETGCRRAWEEATLNPIRLLGKPDRDGLALAARAEDLGLDRSRRGEALVRYLFGRPVSRAARALDFRWCDRAALHPAAAYRRRGGWLG